MYQSLIRFNSLLPLNVGPILSYEDITILVHWVQQQGKGSSLSSAFQAETQSWLVTRDLHGG